MVYEESLKYHPDQVQQNVTTTTSKTFQYQYNREEFKQQRPAKNNYNN